MKNYLAEMVDLTGNSYINPVPAVYDNGTHIRSTSQITSIACHHDAMFREHDYSSLDRYMGEARNNWERLGPGLQYHYKIDNVGTIFQIRPLDTWLYCVGSAENVSTVAICLDGYFHPPYNQKPTREQYEALGQLLTYLCEQRPDFPATWPDVRPHRDFSATACPGDRFAGWVYAIQSRADALNIPADAVYDWPEYQEAPPSVPATPIIEAPIHVEPPVVVPPVVTPPVPPVVIPTPPVVEPEVPVSPLPPVIDVVPPTKPEEPEMPEVTPPTVQPEPPKQAFFNTTLGRLVISLGVIVVPTLIVWLQNFQSDNTLLALGVTILITLATTLKDFLNQNLANK